MEKSDMIPIELTASKLKHPGSDYYYIRNTFSTLRKHQELLRHRDYKRLYDEAQDYLFRHAVEMGACRKEERQRGYDMLVLLADLQNSHTSKYTLSFPFSHVKKLLSERKKIWDK